MMLGLNFTGAADAYVDQLNVVMRDEAKSSGGQSPMLQSRLSSMRSYLSNATESEELFKSIFAVPTLDGAPFVTMPYWFGPLLARETEKPSEEEGDNQEEETRPDRTGGVKLAEVAKRLNRIESPVLRAWVAMKSQDSATAAKVLGSEVPKEAAGDAELLRSILALGANKPVESYDALARMRATISGNADLITWAVDAQLGVALQLSAEEQVEPCGRSQGPVDPGATEPGTQQRKTDRQRRHEASFGRMGEAFPSSTLCRWKCLPDPGNPGMGQRFREIRWSPIFSAGPGSQVCRRTQARGCGHGSPAIDARLSFPIGLRIQRGG
ncbi:MAG: hypothetical protein QM755_06670 [Luteolibacter sp.]